MEFLDGVPLSLVISAPTQPDLVVKCQMMLQAAEALAYAHRQGVLHRDVKPSNIQVLPDLSIKVLDFGIASASSGQSTQTVQGIVLGHLKLHRPRNGYMARRRTRSQTSFLLG